MRISQLIQLLRAEMEANGNRHVVAYDRHGDEGLPVVEERTTFKSGNKNPTYRVFVISKTEE